MLGSVVTTVQMSDDGNAVTRLIGVFDAIALQEGWQPDDQLIAHVHRSVYFVLAMDCQVVGGIQLELDDASDRWSFQTVWPDSYPSEGIKTAHIAILALIPEVRGQQRLFWLPCIELWRYCRSHDIKELWLEATPTTLAVYRRIGWPLEIVGDLALHWGEPCYLCRMGVFEVEATLVRKAIDCAMYRDLVDWAHRTVDDSQ